MKIIKDAGLVRTVHASTFCGQRIAADVSIWTYAIVTMFDRNFVQYFLDQYQRFKNNGIDPIYIFDGPPKECKSETIERRKETSAKSKRPQPCQDHFEVLKSVFSHMNIEWRQAKHETDNLCSELFHSGEVAAGFSRDGDFLAYGIETLIIKFADDKMDVIYLKDVLEHLKLSYDIFVDFCITLGTDYNKNVRGIGPVNALKNAQNGKIVKVAEHDAVYTNFYQRFGVEAVTGEKQYDDIRSPNFVGRLKTTLSLSCVKISVSNEVRSVHVCCGLESPPKNDDHTEDGFDDEKIENEIRYIENF